MLRMNEVDDENIRNRQDEDGTKSLTDKNNGFLGFAKGWANGNEKQQRKGQAEQ